MKKKRRRRLLLFIIVCTVIVIGYRNWPKDEMTTLPAKQSTSNTALESGGEVLGGLGANEATPSTGSDNPSSNEPTTRPAGGQAVDGIMVIAKPESISVLVNKQNKLPEGYSPDDLVYPDVRFIVPEKVEKRKMRKEAAEALEKMFKAAENDDILLAGVSAYRSHKTQQALFQRYVDRDGLEKARTYSALPGTSEHETGLAIDISGADGKCAAADCFADTDEADWLKNNAYKYGFIIRYPEGKADITGYQYEPWHMRYVGIELATELEQKGESLEEFYDAVPVNGQ